MNVTSRSSRSRWHYAPWLAAALLIIGFAAVVIVDSRPLLHWFITPDQQAQDLFGQRQYAQAAGLFSDPLRQGNALFRDAQFEAAAAAFTRVNTAEAHFNRGNALVMGGKYEEAIDAYQRALELRPNWQPALDNREIARLRAERVRRSGGDMTGGAMEADEIVFETGKSPNQGGDRIETETEGGKALSDQELRSLWLRRVQTKPADFLRAKFALQLATAKAPAPAGNTKTAGGEAK
jgi:Ca-activated chloride channel family protein